MEDLVLMDDLTPDPENCNSGTERGSAALVNSIKAYGVGRPVVVDKNGVLIAGNKTKEAAEKAGITKVRIIETSGDELIVHKRTDLDLDSMVDGRARGLAIADNRISQISQNMNMERVNQQVAQLHLDLEPLGYTLEELKLEKAAGERESEGAGGGSSAVPDAYQVVVICEDERDQRQAYETLKEQGFNVRLVTI